MCCPVITELIDDLLTQYRNTGRGVSFQGLGRKWNRADDVVDVVEKIKNCPELLFLELEGNTLGVGAAKAIGKALESKPELKIALWKDLFTGRLKHEIPEAMKFLFAGVDLAGARLEYLDLSDNAIGPVGMAGLAPFFRSKSSFSLKVLICNNNGMGPQGGEELSKALLTCRSESISQEGEPFRLKKFVCGRNRLQNTGAIAISRFISVCECLEEIHMPENSIYWAAQIKMADAFIKNPQLRVINLNDNTITKDGLTKLAEAFQNLPELENLNLGDCLLRSDGAVTVVSALKNLTHLKKLDLGSNEINQEAAIKIAQILRTISSLEFLDLNENNFGADGGGEVIKAMLPNVEVFIEDIDDSDEDEDGEEDGEEDDSEDVDEEEDSEEGEEEEVEEEEDNFDDDIVRKVVDFFTKPTIKKYGAIPKPGPLEYLYDAVEFLEKEPHEICIAAAVQLVEYHAKKEYHVDLFTRTIFCELMSEAVRITAGQGNDFATCLLINMGFFRGENRKFVRNELSDTTISYLAFWLIFLHHQEDVLVPRRVCSFLKCFFLDPRPNFYVNRPKLEAIIDYIVLNVGQAPGNTDYDDEGPQSFYNTEDDAAYS